MAQIAHAGTGLGTSGPVGVPLRHRLSGQRFIVLEATADEGLYLLPQVGCAKDSGRPTYPTVELYECELEWIAEHELRSRDQ